MKEIAIFIGVVLLINIVNKIRYSKIKQISVIELKDYLNSKNKENIYLDVRTPSEYRNNKIKGFKNIPVGELHSRLDELPKDKNIFVICQTGARSNSASRLLYKSDFENVINVKGGLSSWNSHNN